MAGDARLAAWALSRLANCRGTVTGSIESILDLRQI
jgi:hypothetical protein